MFVKQQGMVTDLKGEGSLIWEGPQREGMGGGEQPDLRRGRKLGCGHFHFQLNFISLFIFQQ